MAGLEANNRELTAQRSADQKLLQKYPELRDKLIPNVSEKIEDIEPDSTKRKYIRVTDGFLFSFQDPIEKNGVKIQSAVIGFDGKILKYGDSDGKVLTDEQKTQFETT
jgi:hypothetical protein